MHMKIAGNARWIILAAIVALLTVLGTYASAREVQLAGIRLDAPWVTVLDVYGTPDGVVTYGGGGAAAGQPGGMGGGMMGGEMGGMGGGMMGPGMGGGMMGGPMMGGGMMGGGMGAPMGMGMGAGMGGGEMGGMGGGMMGGGGPAAGGGGGGGGGGWPMWALPVWVVLEEGEVEWFYRKGDVCLGFVFNRDGYVRVIAVAGESCDYARTALWRPHRYIKLGDDFKRVLYRYGYPDEVEPFTADVGGGGGGGAAPGGGGMAMGGGEMGGGMGPGMMGAGGPGPGAGMPAMGGMPGMGGPGAMGGGAAPAGGGGGGGGTAAAGLGSVSVTFNGQTNSFSRDAVLTYSDNNNIAFTLHNMKVTRIHIWK